MTDRAIWRGDSYEDDRPVLMFAVADRLGAPYNLNGCIIRVTAKAFVTDIAADPTDSTAPIKGDLVIDVTGTPTTSVNLELQPGHAASEGLLQLVLTPAETAALAAGLSLNYDVQIEAEPGKPWTVPMLGTLSTVDGYTNRSGTP